MTLASDTITIPWYHHSTSGVGLFWSVQFSLFLTVCQKYWDNTMSWYYDTMSLFLSLFVFPLFPPLLSLSSFAGTPPPLCASSTCRHGDESWHKCQTRGYDVPQDLYSKAWQCEVRVTPQIARKMAVSVCTSKLLLKPTIIITVIFTPFMLTLYVNSVPKPCELPSLTVTFFELKIEPHKQTQNLLIC